MLTETLDQDFVAGERVVRRRLERRSPTTPRGEEGCNRRAPSSLEREWCDAARRGGVQRRREEKKSTVVRREERRRKAKRLKEIGAGEEGQEENGSLSDLFPERTHFN